MSVREYRRSAGQHTYHCTQYAGHFRQYTNSTVYSKVQCTGLCKGGTVLCTVCTLYSTVICLEYVQWSM